MRICSAPELFLLIWNTRQLTIREEHKLRVFENRALRRIFRAKRDGVTGGWRKLLTTSFIICILPQV
jgi:hypothetical protein